MNRPPKVRPKNLTLGGHIIFQVGELSSSSNELMRIKRFTTIYGSFVRGYIENDNLCMQVCGFA